MSTYAAAILGALTLLALFAGFFSFGWIVHASLTHRLSVFGCSFDKDKRSKPFHRALFGIGVASVLNFCIAVMSFVALLDRFAWGS